ncbi:MAG: GNAT family N-acetyltransferase [Pseudomonadales bacterium]|nr:GNAT family N-acetyltransferase [Pseudomonadales bacterium]MDP6469514.1 GNAT family N-acetyltransferase [Pseudomonadales bacterium]MDP6827355.1 GNAT family N-acetyltransferase [Pseudomonadales bacterium]MDP6971178.1 GNAT family N-acetyltransferase [Pseudomonadales bacterium]
MTTREQILIHDLELPREHPVSAPARRAYRLRESEEPCPELSRFLYVSVGYRWYWYERLQWTYQQWLEYLSDPAVSTRVAYKRATPVGYFELHREPDGRVEIAYFGLLPSFIGRGLGGSLLADAIAAARQFGDGRVWLHTCSLDHPAALPNYLARGFIVTARHERLQTLPDEPLETWPGAQMPISAGPGATE